jgi:excisionase family DNA binding protein
MSDPQDLLDIKEAARFLKVSETSLRRWTNAGQLACLRVGRRRERRFRRADLLAFMEERPAGATVGAPRTSAPQAQHTIIGGIPVPFGSHVASLYADNAGRAKQAVAFLADGLHPGTVCYLVTAPDARDDILTHLAYGRPSLEQDIADGRLVLSQHAASARAQYEYFETNFIAAARAGAHSLRVVGDMWAFAEMITRPELVEYEAGFDHLLAQRFPVVTLCQYDVRRFSSLDVFNALKGHKDTFRYPVERVVS